MNKILVSNNECYMINSNSLMQYITIKLNFGSICDEFGGEAHLLEHIVVTCLYSIIEKNEIVCRLDAFTNYHSTCFTFSFLKSEHQKIKRFLIPSIFSLTKKQIEKHFYSEINVVKQEYEYYKKQNFDKLLERSIKHFFKEIKHDELGTANSLLKLNPEFLYALYVNYYKPDNSNVFYYGTFDSGNAKRIDKNSNFRESLSKINFKEVFKIKDNFVCDCFSSKNNISIMSCFLIKNIQEYSSFIKLVVDYYFSSTDSVLFANFREKGLVYNFGGGYVHVVKNKALIVVYVETSKKNKELVVNMINEYIANLNLTSDLILKDLKKIVFNSTYLMNDFQITQTMAKDMDLLVCLNNFLSD